MLSLPASARIYLCPLPVDLRKGIDGLLAVIRRQAEIDPFSGALFVFTGRGRSRIKVLRFERGGFVLLLKRLEQGRFAWPAPRAGTSTLALTPAQLAMLLEGLDFRKVPVPVPWTPKGQEFIFEGGCSFK